MAKNYLLFVYIKFTTKSNRKKDEEEGEAGGKN